MMEQYKVICFFTDLQDNNYAYHVGDSYPREGVAVTAERIKELASADNRQKKPLIKLVEGEKPETAKKPAASARKKSSTKKG